MINTPTKPMIIADHLKIPILSPRMIIDKITINIGEENVNVVAVAKLILMMEM